MAALERDAEPGDLPGRSPARVRLNSCLVSVVSLARCPRLPQWSAPPSSMVRGGNLQKGIYEPCQRAVHEEFVVESQVWAKTVSRAGQRPISDPAFMRLNFRSDWRHDIAQSALALL